MRNNNIPFKIGMQYENWEFSLDILPDRIKGLDSYLNIDESFNRFLNVYSDKTELIFNLDILEGVILTFENRTQIFYKELKEKMFSDLEILEELNICYLSQCEDYFFTLGHGIIYKDKVVCLCYCNKTILLQLLYALIQE